MIQGDNDRGIVRAYLDFARDHWRTIVVATVLGAVAAAIFANQQTPQYRTSSQVLFRQTTVGQQVAGVPVFENPQANSTAGSEMTTNITLLGSESVAKAVIRRLDLDTDVQGLLGRVAVEQVGLSNVGEITARATSARESQQIADTWAEVFIDQRRRADQAKLGDAVELLRDRLDRIPESQSRSRLATQSREQLERLELLQSVQDGNAEVVLPAGLPARPFSPRWKRAGVIGALLGALLGLGIAALRRALDRRVKNPEEISEILGVPLLAELSPDVFTEQGSIVHGSSREGGQSWRTAEDFRTLATNLRYLGEGQKHRSIAVTSAAPAEGKTTTVSNLVATLTRLDRPTAVIDADLRRGRLGEVFGVDNRVGLSSVTAGLSSADSAWTAVKLPPDDDELSVMPAGPPPPDPIQLLESESFRDLIDEAGKSYEYVVIDTPPVLVVSDPIAVAKAADAVLLVVRVSKTTRDQLKRLMTSLQQVGVRPIGVVVTDVRRSGSSYTGAYGYYGESGPPRALETSRGSSPA